MNWACIFSACKEAYGSEDVSACVQGCNSQVVTASRRQRQVPLMFTLYVTVIKFEYIMIILLL